MDNPIMLREYDYNIDYPYILKTYTQQLHQVCPLNFIPNGIFFPYYTNLINEILEKNKPLMCVLEDDTTSIVGYLIAKNYGKDNIIVYWGTTKGIYRRMGIMKTLLSAYDYEQKNIITTQYFSLFKPLKDKYNLIFDPTVKP